MIRLVLAGLAQDKGVGLVRRRAADPTSQRRGTAGPPEDSRNAA